MSTSGHKRKRSLQGTPIDLTKMANAISHLNALKAELEDIIEAENEMEAVMAHIRLLEKILDTAKKPRLDFSSVTDQHLTSLGVAQKSLVFQAEGLARLCKVNATEPTLSEYRALCSRLKHIYSHVNMDYEAAARMVLDAVLLSLPCLLKSRKSNRGIVILPEMGIATGEGVFVSNPETQFQIWLTGQADYGVIEYPLEHDHRERLLIDGGKHALKLRGGRLVLVEAKRTDDKTLSEHMPEALSQAIALREITKEQEVRFCLSNGVSWIFALLKVDEKDGRVCYSSYARRLDKYVIESHDGSSGVYLYGAASM